MQPHCDDVCLRVLLPGLLKDLQLEHGGVTVEGTPRRIVVMASGLATQQQQVLFLAPLLLVIHATRMLQCIPY